MVEIFAHNNNNNNSNNICVLVLKIFLDLMLKITNNLSTYIVYRGFFFILQKFAFNMCKHLLITSALR